MKDEQYGASLASVYDRLNSGVDYSELCDFAEKVFTKYGKANTKISSVCEIACGTGNASIELSKRGYHVVASDISEEMLSVAEKKAREVGEKILFVKADMRDFSLYARADAVLCFFDSINYLTTSTDVKSCFESVHNVLSDEGLFLFDVNTLHKFECVYSDNSYIIEDDGILCAWQNYYNCSTRKCDFYLSIFSERYDGLYTREDENQQEKMYTVRQLCKYLDESGFEVADICGDYNFSVGDEHHDDRLYFICRKK